VRFVRAVYLRNGIYYVETLVRLLTVACLMRSERWLSEVTV